MKNRTTLLSLLALTLALSVALYVPGAADAKGGKGGGRPAHAAGPPAHAAGGGGASARGPAWSSTGTHGGHGQVKKAKAKGRPAAKKATQAVAKAVKAAKKAEKKAKKSAERGLPEGASPAEAKNPAGACMLERARTGDEAFADDYGTNRNKRNAFGKCVSEHARSMSDEDDAAGTDRDGASVEEPAAEGDGEGDEDADAELGDEAATLFALAFG